MFKLNSLAPTSYDFGIITLKSPGENSRIQSGASQENVF